LNNEDKPSFQRKSTIVVGRFLAAFAHIPDFKAGKVEEEQGQFAKHPK
jgi:hypothetical protein